MVDADTRAVLESTLKVLEQYLPGRHFIDHTGEFGPVGSRTEHPSIVRIRLLLAEPSPMCPPPRPHRDLLDVATALADRVGALDAPGRSWDGGVVPADVLNMVDDIRRAANTSPMLGGWRQDG